MGKGNYADVNDIKMYYEIHGEGEPLVLIHGGGSTIETSFGNILPLFAKHYKVIAVELQAHGRTSDREAPETFEQDADDVAALLKHLNIAEAFILGFSNGGSTALQFAIRHPVATKKIIVVAGAYRRDGFFNGFFDGFENAKLDMMPRILQEGFLKVKNDNFALLNMFNKDVERMKNFKDWSDEDVKNIKAPALVISGDKDVTTVEHALKISQLIPQAELLVLPGIHGVCLGEVEIGQPTNKQYEATAALIKEFLDK